MDMVSTLLRRLSRATALVLGLALGLVAAPAYAEPPSSPFWEDGDSGTLLDQLLILGGIPLAVILLITLLTYLPAMTNRQSSESALAFAERSEWFGGPRQGVGAAPDTTPQDSAEKGGAGASW